MGKRTDHLILDVCGTPDHPLASRLEAWAAADRAFVPFVERERSKVRRKIRQAAGEHALEDVAAELAVAAALLHERRWTLDYEPLAASGGRGPDFRVASPDGSGAWFVEVARLRPDPQGALSPLPLRLARVLADKVAQLPAGAVNVLAVQLPPGVDGATVLTDALRLLDGAAPAPGALDGRAFARGRPKLGAVLLCSDGHPPDVQVMAGARHPAPVDLVRRLRALPWA